MTFLGMLRSFRQLTLLGSTRFSSTFSNQKRFRRTTQFKANIGVRRILKSLTQEGHGHCDTLGAEDLDDDDDYDKDVLQADKTFDQFCQEEDTRQKRVLYKIINKKYFKSTPEPTLLSWAAKEQLRYLHETEPKTWTPEKLANSFPISVDGVKKLLKSKYRHQTEKGIAKHDQSVLNNWKLLKAGKGPIATAIGQRLSSGKLNFETLDGDETLPMPTKKWKQNWLPESNFVKTTNNTLPGEFESLVKDYHDLTLKSNTEKPIRISSVVGEEMKDNHLEHFSSRDLPKSSKPISFEEFKEQMRKQLLKSPTNNQQHYEKFESWLSENEAPKAGAIKAASSVGKEAYNDQFDDVQNFFEGRMQKFKDPPLLD